MPITLKSTGGGSVSIDVPSTGSTFTLTAPANNATIFTTDGGAITGNVAFTSNNVSIGGQTISPFVGMKNRIINGNMAIDQRATATSTHGNYTVDRWQYSKSNDATESIAQNSDAPAGFSYSLRNTVTVGDTSIGSGQFCGVYQPIEGYNIADLSFGTSSAKPVTVSFWVKATQTGTYVCNLFNNGASRMCWKQYTVNASNTWEYKTLTFPGCTDGTWYTNNAAGLSVYFLFALGSSFTGGSDGVWNSGPYYGPSGMTNGIGTNGNIWAITGVQLEVGPVATPFENRPYGTELALCQRYYVDFKDTYSGIGMTSATIGVMRYVITLPVTMRAGPTVTYSDVTAGYTAYSLGGSANEKRINTEVTASARADFRPGISIKAEIEL